LVRSCLDTLDIEDRARVARILITLSSRPLPLGELKGMRLMGTPTLYTFLEWMKKRGLVESSRGTQARRGRPRVVYRLTPAGRELLPFETNPRLPLLKARSYYNSVSIGYDKREARFPLSRFIDELKLRRLMPLLPRNRAVPILDAGGGTGKWSIRLAEMGYRNIHLVDVSEGMLAVAWAKIFQRGLLDRIRIHHADVCDLPFPNSHFGLIVADGNLLSLVQDPERCLKELHRVLRRGGGLLTATNGLYGLLLLSLFEGRPLEKCLEIYRRKVANLDGFNFRLFTPEELKALFEAAGFRDVRVRADAVSLGFLSNRRLANISRDKEEYERVIDSELALTDCEDLSVFGAQLVVTATK
jgi:ubiquinone/menaquinone biosynthesis C-methylase UbiE/DNA-binding HxlR family transcriptional regulator